MNALSYSSCKSCVHHYHGHSGRAKIGPTSSSRRSVLRYLGMIRYGRQSIRIRRHFQARGVCQSFRESWAWLCQVSPQCLAGFDFYSDQSANYILIGRCHAPFHDCGCCVGPHRVRSEYFYSRCACLRHRNALRRNWQKQGKRSRESLRRTGLS